MDKSDKKELKQMGKKKFIATEKKDIAEAKKSSSKGAKMPKKGCGPKGKC